MHVILRIIGGLLIAAFGFLFVWKTDKFLQTFGTIPWAERHLGLDGGSRLFYKLLGVLLVAIGFLMMTGMIGGLLVATVGRLFTPSA